MADGILPALVGSTKERELLLKIKEMWNKTCLKLDLIIPVGTDRSRKESVSYWEPIVSP